MFVQFIIYDLKIYADCEPDWAELEYRMWGQYSCQQVQYYWNLCTDEEDVNHKTAMYGCPATCKIARNECPGNFVFSTLYLYV